MLGGVLSAVPGLAHDDVIRDVAVTKVLSENTVGKLDLLL